MVVLSALGELSRLNSGFDPILYAVQILTIIACFGALAVFGWDLWLVWRGKRRWTAKVWSVALLVRRLGDGLGRLVVPPDRRRRELLMPRVALEARREKLRLAAPFRITGYVFEETEVVVVTLADGGHGGGARAAAAIISATTPIG